MSRICGSCGDAFDGSKYYLEVEWPADDDGGLGKLAFYQCADCAKPLAIGLLAARASDDGLEEILTELDVDVGTIAPEATADP